MRGYLRLSIVAFLGWLLVGCISRPVPVVVEWSTETEVDTVGFNLYRAELPEGPFEQVNTQIIPSSPDPLIGGRYVYTDTDVVAGRTYYYELEDVESGGATTRHGPITVTAGHALPLWAWPAAGVTVIVVLLFGWGQMRQLRLKDRESP